MVVASIIPSWRGSLYSSFSQTTCKRNGGSHDQGLEDVGVSGYTNVVSVLIV